MSIGDRPLFSWLHLSDLHFGHGSTAYQWDQRNLLNCLERDIETATKEWRELPAIGAIFVTGDVAFSGGATSKSEYRDALAFFNRVRKILDPASKTPIFIVPGNHDVRRNVAKDLTDAARSSPDELDAILADPTRRTALLARFADYKAFADHFGQRDVDVWTASLPGPPELGDIAVVGLNTALLSNDDNDRTLLHLAHQQRSALTNLRTDFRIVLTHHPLGDEWMRDEASLQAVVQEHTQLHLCGHVHDPTVDLLAKAGGQNHVRLVAAAAHKDPKQAGSDKVSHGYNFASLMVDTDGGLLVRSWPRRWFPRWASFRVDHLGVPDRRNYDDKTLGRKLGRGSGLAAESADESGSLGTHWWGSPSVRWNELLADRQRVDIFGIAMGELFESPNREHFEAFLERGGKMNIVVADPRNKTGMARYDEDFGQRLGRRTERVCDTLRALRAVRKRLGDRANQLVVKLSKYSFKYSAYRLDDEYIFVPYRMMPGKKTANTPGLLLDGAGSLARRFLAEDLEALLEQGEPLTDDVLASILDERN